MSKILTTQCYRNRRLPHSTTGTVNNQNDGIASPSRYGVFLADLDQTGEKNIGEYFEEIPLNRIPVPQQVCFQYSFYAENRFQIFVQFRIGVGKWIKFN